MGAMIATPLFHAVNLVLHVGVTLLVFQLGLQLSRARSVALIAAVLFGVHPIHTEAVTGIVGRAEILAAFFGLLTLVWTISAADDNNRKSGRDALALLAFTAAVLGGIGSLPGAVIGGILIGLIETMWSAYFSIDYKDVAAFSVLAIVLIFLPQGLFGRPTVINNVITFASAPGSFGWSL